MEICSTLVHEMVHLYYWHFEEDKTPRYHSQVWSKKMRSIGLAPLGEDGKVTGYRVSHEVMPGGPFFEAFEKMMATTPLRLSWVCREIEQAERNPEGKKRKEVKRYDKNKVKYVCPVCQVKVWGRAGLNILCGGCGGKFERA